MQFEIYLLITQYAIFYNRYVFTCAKALVGQNVKEAQQNEFSYIVSIVVTNNLVSQVEMNHRCTGTLVTNHGVLTAEHCVGNLSPSAFKIMVGSIDLRQCTEYYAMWWLSYNLWIELSHRQLEFIENDIAFIRLIENIPNTIRPAVIEYIPTHLFNGLDVVTVGWGLISNGTSPRILQTVDLKVIRKTDCEQKISALQNIIVPIHHRYICTVADPYALLHDGDSGGPLLFIGTVIAVNKGLVPVLNETLNPEQVNLHTGCHYYKSFILYASSC